MQLVEMLFLHTPQSCTQVPFRVKILKLTADLGTLISETKTLLKMFQEMGHCGHQRDLPKSPPCLTARKFVPIFIATLFLSCLSFLRWEIFFLADF